MINFFKEVFSHFLKSDIFEKAASLAYYAVFSILPMIMIITSVLGIFLGEQAISGEIYTQLKSVLGNDAAIQIQNFIKNQHINHNSILTTIIGFIALFFSASALFRQIHKSFNSMWGIKLKPNKNILNFLKKHLVPHIIIIGLFFIIFVSTTIHSLIVKEEIELDFNYQFLYLSELLISLVVFSIVFAIMFKFLSDAKIHWKVALFGGLFTAILFSLGKLGIGMYIGKAHISTTFGSASVIALLMVWVYYTSQIIFLGASFVKVLSDRLGLEIIPENYASKVINVN